MKPRDSDLITQDDVNSLSALFRERVRRTPDAPAYRFFDQQRGQWEQITWVEMAARVGRWQSAMSGEGLKRGDRVALMLSNGPDWVCFDQAALALGLVVVPLFVNDRPDSVAYVLHRTGARLLLVETAEQWRLLSPALQTHQDLRVVVRDTATVVDDPRLVFLADWLSASQADEARTAAGAHDDLATIVFTSGTVGRPKGVMLSHGNILWNACASYRSNPIYTDDLFLSFLPLSHMFERTLGYYLPMMAGSTVAFARSVAQLAEDLPVIRPTVLISVPRIYERIHARIGSQMAERSDFARQIFRRAVHVGWGRFEREQNRGGWKPAFAAWPVFRRLVADKVLVRLGGHIRIAVCGGAPLSAEVARTFIGLGLPLVQGYGMTELAPVASGNSLRDNDPASVGRPLRDVEIRISPEGELLVKSPGVMMGYLDDPEATARTIDADGWLHTGDKAELRSGRLYITGRLKDIIVLSNGEKVPPADMEMAIMRDPLFEQVMVIGEGRPYLAALAVLNRDQWTALATQMGLDSEEPAVLDSPRLMDEICKRISRLIIEFPGYAQIRRAAVTLEPWTVDSGLLTPTLKLRRAQVMERFDGAVARLYAGH